jgi:peptidoglycan/xylan/chitin deacetylase (PgdA/CDA1 family)
VTKDRDDNLGFEPSGPLDPSAASAASASPATAAAARQAQYERRRAVAALGLMAFVALLVALLSGGGGSHRAQPSARAPAPRPKAPAHAGGRAVAPAGITPQQTAAIDRVLRYTNTISAGGGRRREIALTFDDGPSTFTPQVLAILRQEHAPATFFQMGRAIQQFPDLARDEFNDGYPIADHTFTHPPLARLSARDQKNEIAGAAKAIHAYGAPYPRLFRPPFGSFNATTLKILRAQHMLMVMWTVDTRDFSQPGAQRIIYTALSGARPGAIILMHDAGGPRAQTVAALPRIIKVLRRRHYRLVTVPQLILDDPPAPGQENPH